MEKKIKKKDIINNLSESTGYSKIYSQKMLNDLLNCIIKNISKDGLYLKNFGIFKLLHKNERIGRNPKTKEVFKINARNTLKFIPSKKFKNYLNDI